MYNLHFDQVNIGSVQVFLQPGPTIEFTIYNSKIIIYNLI